MSFNVTAALLSNKEVLRKIWTTTFPWFYLFSWQNYLSVSIIPWSISFFPWTIYHFSWEDYLSHLPMTYLSISHLSILMIELSQSSYDRTTYILVIPWSNYVLQSSYDLSITSHDRTTYLSQSSYDLSIYIKYVCMCMYVCSRMLLLPTLSPYLMCLYNHLLFSVSYCLSPSILWWCFKETSLKFD